MCPAFATAPGRTAMHSLPHLPVAIAREVLATLYASLPPSAGDTPEAQAERDSVAMAAVAALRPGDAMEAKLAAEVVAADAYAMDCRRLAAQYRNDLAITLRCRAQANSATREMRSLLRELRRMQAERQAAGPDIHPAIDPAEPAPAITEPVPVPADAVEPWDTLTEVERYATLYPDRAACIRRHGGLPAKLDFGPPDPDIVEAIVSSTSPILRALDQQQRAAATT